MEPVLQLTKPDLDQQDAEHDESGGEQAGRRRAPGGEVAEQEEEGATEDGDDACVGVQDRLEPCEAMDFCRPSARVWTCRRRERSADDQGEAGNRDAEPEQPQFARKDRLGPAARELVGERNENHGTGQRRSVLTAR